MGINITRNDAYKLARKIWRAHLRPRRGYGGFGHIWATVAENLRSDGHTEADIAMIRVWLKAFEAGRRYPDESKVRNIEINIGE